MSDPFCTVAGVATRVGYCGTTTAKILIASLRGGTVQAACSGGSVAVPTLVGYGDDNSAQPGKYVCATGVLLVTGLSPFTDYTYSVTVDGQTISGSFTTLPVSSVVDWGFFMQTCEQRSSAAQWMKEPIYSRVRELAAASDVPVLFTAHIDDILYADAFKWFAPGGQTDAITGLYITAGAGQQGPCATGLRWDYAVAWCSWLALLPSVAELVHPDRVWLMRNMPMWAIWGDHDIAPDNGNAVYDGLGSSSVSWGANRAGYNNGTGNTANLEAKAEEMYEAFCAQACAPPRMSADGGPATQAGAQYWGAAVGPVRFFAYDRNKYSQPYNACDVGDSHFYGRAGTEYRGQCSGAATIPTRTELGVLTDTQPMEFLGPTQLTDMLNWLNNDEPFKVVFAANGIARYNQPWNDYWPSEFEDYIGRASIGLMKNSKTNGTDGHTVHLKGDTHCLSVISYNADGTSSGLGGAAVASGELWEICPGTINGSTIGGSLFNGTIQAGGKLRYKKNGVTQGDRQLAGVVLGRVYASRSPKEFQVDLIELPAKQVLWSGYQAVGQSGNQFQYRASTRQKVG